MLTLIFAVLARIVLGQIFPGHGLDSSNFRQYRELCCTGRRRQRQQMTLPVGVDSRPGFTAKDALEMCGVRFKWGTAAPPFFQAGWIPNQYCSGRCIVQHARVALPVLLSSHMGERFLAPLDVWHPSQNHHTLTPLTQYCLPGTPEFFFGHPYANAHAKSLAWRRPV